MEPVVAMPGSPRNILRQQSLPGLARTAAVGPLTLEHIAPKTRGGEVAKVLTVFLINPYGSQLLERFSPSSYSSPLIP